MAAPAVTIGRLETRVRVPAAEAALAAARLVDAAAARLGPALDTALPRVLAEAGLSEDALVAVPRLALRLRLRGEVDAARLGAAWAEALSEALARALAGRGAGGLAPGSAREADAPPLATELWAAEAALLHTLAAGAPLPWWAEDVAPGLDAPGGIAALLAGWIARDPARAAAAMARVLVEAPALAAALAPRAAAALAEDFRRALRGALGVAATAPPPPPAAREAAALAAARAALPASVRVALAALPPALRAPWAVAAVLAHAPRFAATLEALLDALVAAPAEDARAEAPPPPAEAAARAASAPPERQAAPSPAPAAPRAPETRPMQRAEVAAGGLLLLLRPLAARHPAWLAEPEALPGRLLGLGLIALQRLAAPLPPAARRAALERDRPLLAVFTGAAPPEGPLDELRAPDPLEAEATLAGLLAAAPTGVAPMPGALRRRFGDGNPFTDDPATDALARLVLRPGRLRWDDAAAELAWPLEAADAALRRAGWDLDPGWLPWIGRRITFRYGGAEDAP